MTMRIPVAGLGCRCDRTAKRRTKNTFPTSMVLKRVKDHKLYRTIGVVLCRVRGELAEASSVRATRRGVGDLYVQVPANAVRAVSASGRPCSRTGKRNQEIIVQVLDSDAGMNEQTLALRRGDPALHHNLSLAYSRRCECRRAQSHPGRKRCGVTRRPRTSR